MENTVTNNKHESRFEIALDAGKTAFIDYTQAGEGILALTHTEVPEEFEGKGVGSTLVKGAFEILEAEGLKIIPACRFVAVYLKRHPEHESLVASV